MTLFNSKYNCIISKLKTKSQAYIITEIEDRHRSSKDDGQIGAQFL